MMWISENYDNIIEWSKNITKSDELSEELAHYSLEKLLTHPKRDELEARHNADPDYGHLRGFLLAIMRNSWYGKKSEFSRIHKAHRADIGHRKRVITDDHMTRLLDTPEELYDHEKDRISEAIDGLLEEMTLDQDKLWFCARLFKMWIETPNFSELSRRTDIPRTSISNAVEEARAYILDELKQRGII